MNIPQEEEAKQPTDTLEEVLSPVPKENAQEENPEPTKIPISIEPNRPKPQELLAYGTHVHLSNTIHIVPSMTEEVTVAKEKEETALSFTEKLATDINFSLNELFNSL